MKERPILFSAPMVRAILEGRKTQTRRILKVQPNTRHREIEFENGLLTEYSMIGGCWHAVNKFKCPYGKPQDQLWVRETWCVANIYDHIKPSEINPAGDKNWCGVRYPANQDAIGIKKRPSIFMPRWASRIDLLIKDIRVERLQDISEEDAIAEGIEVCGRGYRIYSTENKFTFCPITSFKSLWNSINGPDSWDANPWCWVVDFQHIQTSKNQEAA